MRLKAKSTNYVAGGIISTLLVFAIGFVILAFDSRLSRLLTHASYDWSFDLSKSFRPDISDSSVVIVYIDEDSLKELNKSLLVPMNRSFQAELLERLKNEGARSVTMDIIFSDPSGNEATDEKLAKALRDNGHVILGVDYNPEEDNARPGAVSEIKPLTFPYPPFEQAAKNGLVLLHPDADFLVRQHFHFLSDVEDAPPSLSWATAQLTGLKVAQNPTNQVANRWVYYYGPPGAIPHVSFKQAYYADGLKPGFFRNKIVFIGARPITGNFLDKRDELRSPYSASGGKFLFMPMVEIHATEFLNLLREDWLIRPSPKMEIAIMALAACLFGFGLFILRPRAATIAALIGAGLVIVIAQALFVTERLWFTWMIIVAVQIPFALLYSITVRSMEWYIQRRKLEEERRKADAQIREQAALLDKAQDAIVVHDLEWRAQFWNKSAERLYGWTFDDLKQKDLKSDVFKADQSKMLEALQDSLRFGEWTGELNQTTREGKPLIVQSRWTLVRDDIGNPKSVLVINTDITEKKKLESQFLRTQRMESIGTLAGGIAHDLNNVLSPILMGVELLKMKTPEETCGKILKSMASSAKRGSDMVKQVLTFARGHEGERTVLQMSHLVREMEKIVHETFPKSIDFKVELEKNLSPVMGDATQIHQIILNLCVNARDAMPDGGNITIAARNVTLSENEAKKFTDAKPINYVLLSVSDTGTGIPPHVIDKIFEPFFTTKEIGKGTGLGLSTVISIIKNHGAFLDLQSEVGKGTSFNVYIPAAEVAMVDAANGAKTDELFGKGEMVLLVDDEPAVLELTKTILTHYGYKVITAIHGADALTLHSQYGEQINLVIMDMMMPVMDGPTAILELKQRHPGLRFIAVSGLMQSDKIKEQLGTELTFMAKPFSPDELLKQMRKVLSDSTPTPGSEPSAMAA